MSRCGSDDVCLYLITPRFAYTHFMSPNIGRDLHISTPFQRAAVVELKDARKFPFLKRFLGPVVA